MQLSVDSEDLVNGVDTHTWLIAAPRQQQSCHFGNEWTAEHRTGGLSADCDKAERRLMRSVLNGLGQAMSQGCVDHIHFM